MLNAIQITKELFKIKRTMEDTLESNSCLCSTDDEETTEASAITSQSLAVLPKIESGRKFNNYHGSHGSRFQSKLLYLFFMRAVNNKFKFHLGTQMFKFCGGNSSAFSYANLRLNDENWLKQCRNVFNRETKKLKSSTTRFNDIPSRTHFIGVFFKSVAKFVHCCKVRSMEEDEREMRLFLLHVRSVPPSDGHLCQKLLSAASFHFSSWPTW